MRCIACLELVVDGRHNYINACLLVYDNMASIHFKTLKYFYFPRFILTARSKELGLPRTKILYKSCVEYKSYLCLKEHPCHRLDVPFV
jgi:hypothetical protein